MENEYSIDRIILEDTLPVVLEKLWRDFACERVHELRKNLPKYKRREAVGLAIKNMRDTCPYTHVYKTFEDHHSDEEVRDMLILELEREPTKDEWLKKLQEEYKFIGVLSQWNIKIIEEYSLKLFDTFSEETTMEDIYKYIFKLYSLIIHFKANYNNRHLMLGFEEARYKFSEKDINRKARILKQKVWEVYNMTGSNISSLPQHQELEKILKKVYKNPESYIPKKQSSKLKTNDTFDEIKSFLNSLPLKNKKQTIDEFCKKIK